MYEKDDLGLEKEAKLYDLDKKPVYRFFDKEEYADSFMRGEIRLGTLKQYREDEDLERGDAEEASETYNTGYAVGRGDDPEIIRRAQNSGMYFGPNCGEVTLDNNTRITSLPEAYVLCTTLEFPPKNLSDVFGEFSVEITNPDQFFITVSNKLNSISSTQGVAGSIQYQDRSYMGMESRPGLIGFVKPASYSSQKEFRFLWRMSNNPAETHLTIQCPEVSDLFKKMPRINRSDFS